MDSILQILIPLLPRYPEEGSDASRISKQVLLAALTEQIGLESVQSVQTTVEMVENLLTSLSFLDCEELNRGDWKFVSHPAQLCALSLLNTLADPSQKLFTSDFWQTAGVGDDEKQQQKKVLEALENRRYAQHVNGSGAAVPIRFVYVAWGIIKLGDKIVCHQREASEHATHYGLIGGRANARDLKKVMGETISNHDLLKTLQAPDSILMSQTLDFTLQRECKEEAKLLHEEGHFETQVWRNLKPYTKCKGAAPNYALTQYFFRLYEIKLSTTGYFALRNHMKTNNRLIECTLDEIASGKTADNAKTLDIEVIYKDFYNDRVTLKQALEALEPSYSNRYALNDEKHSLILSLENDILQGESGNEKPLPIPLTSEQKSLLLALAAHGKGLSMVLNDSEAVTLHEFGWVEIHDEALQGNLQQLSEQLRQADCSLIEVTDSKYFRLSLPPEMLYFDPDFFDFSLKLIGQNNGLSLLTRLQLSTSLGYVAPEQRQKTLQNTLAVSLEKVIRSSNFATNDDVDLPKKVRSALQNEYQSLGLRRLLVSKGCRYKLTCKIADL